MSSDLSSPGNRGFERLDVWKNGVDLACRVYRILKANPDFGLRNQMQRAAVSISSNIAEGYDRGTNKEFIRFLQIARGSSAELRTQAYIAKRSGVITGQNAAEIIESSRLLSKKISRLIAVRKKKF